MLLNPNNNEVVFFPIDEGFNGNLLILDGTGKGMLKRQIINGQPKEWDGNIESGGKADPGQYVFVIKSSIGKEIKHGYITIVR